MARYKRRQKVKRYHRSFYTRGTRIRRGIGIAVLVLAVLGAAWLAAPHVLDWATHTWYTVVKNRDLEAESASRAASSEAAASSAAAEAASSEAASDPGPESAGLDGRMIISAGWAELDAAMLTDDDTLRAAARQLKAQDVAYAVLTLKDANGNIYYASQVAAAAGSIVADPLDAAHIASILREENITPVAQIAAFKDPISPRTDRSMAIHYNGDALWLDAQKDGNPWLNPYSAAAVDYVGDLVEEVQQLGYEQVVLTNVQFPKLSKKQDYGTTNGVSRADQLKADIAALQDRLSDKVTLWFSYSQEQCTDSSVALDVPALTLGVKNLLVTSDTALDKDAMDALETTASDAGVRNMILHDAEKFVTAFYVLE